jgi:hypothetical protein
LLDVAQEHLATLPTNLGARAHGGLYLIGKWTVRDGQMVDFAGRAGPLPDDERLVVVTTYTTITNTASAILDTQVVLYEIAAEA